MKHRTSREKLSRIYQNLVGMCSASLALFCQRLYRASGQLTCRGNHLRLSSMMGLPGKAFYLPTTRVGGTQLKGFSLFSSRRSLNLCGIEMVNQDYEPVLDQLLESSETEDPENVFFINAHCVNVAIENQHYTQVLQETELLLPDGIGIRLAAKLQGDHLIENLNGTDLFPKLCHRLAQAGKSIYLLGGEPGVTDQLVENLNQTCPDLIIAGHLHGYFDKDQESDFVIDHINRSAADVLFVAMGVPLQECWLHQHKDQLSPGLRLAVGGCFDFYSGNKPRAPLWMRKCSIEWIFRLWLEPKRMWRRYLLGNFKFFYYILSKPICPKRSDL